MQKNISRITFQRAASILPNLLYTEGCAESTITSYSVDIRAFLSFLETKYGKKMDLVTVADFTPADAHEYKEWLTQKIAEKKMARATALRRYNALRKLLSLMEVRNGIESVLKGDTWGNKKNAKVWGDDEGESLLPEIISVDEFERIIECIKKSTNKDRYRDIAMFEMLFGTGCRRSELLRLKWSDVDFPKNEFRLHRKKVKNADALLMPPAMKNALLDHANTLKKLGVYVFQCNPKRKKGESDEAFFKREECEQMSNSSFSTIVKKWVVESGIMTGRSSEITAHTLRHTFITECLRNNVPESLIIKYTGHESVDSLAPYKHLIAADCAPVISALAGLRTQRKH